MDLWGDRKETETAEEYQARVDATLAKIKKVKKGLGSFNHLPPRGLFQDLVNVELPRLIDLLVTKMGALDPVKVFASMQFTEGKPMDEAFELQQKLAERGIDLHIVEPKAGRSITSLFLQTWPSVSASWRWEMPNTGKELHATDPAITK